MTRDQVETLIKSDGELVAGRTLFERRPAEDQPGWAAGVLSASLECLDEVPACVRQAERLGLGPRSNWAEGHKAFQAVRRETMRLDDRKYGKQGLTNQEERVHTILILAEFVAKVAYNSTRPDDGFDDESGWNILPVARDLIEVVADSGFERHMWDSLAQ